MKDNDKPIIKTGSCKDFEVVIQICFKKQKTVMEFMNKFLEIVEKR